MVQAVLENTNENLRDRISRLVQQQRAFWGTGTTKEVEFRLEQLKKLRQAVKDHQEEILAAVKADLHKPDVEAYLTEIGVVKEIDYAIKHLRAWAKPQSVALPLEQLPAKARIYSEPLGVVLIIAPWNYPFYLMIAPLVAAIAAGNCALLKPSELAPATSQLVATLIQKTFDASYVAVVEGGIEASQALLDEKFDHIFFTGGTAIGKIVMQAAAKHLTPVTLELGGKSPCIVDAEVHIEYAAKRIVWGKFINAGQTCIAPDYLLVDRRIKPALITAMKTAAHAFYGDHPAASPDYARIINPKQFARLAELLSSGNVVMGGEAIAEQKYIAPTILDSVGWDDRIMQDEIFGPILPVLEYDRLEDAIAQINARPKPLALYLFSKNPQVQQQVLQQTSSGGVCINDTIMQIGPSTLPFGGVGDSGMGSYHGKAGFDTFSHKKSVLYKPFWLDLPLRYAPYAGKLNLLKRIIG
ncbi:MAG TPA: aldehyde dehydrogenase [Coleofasciculaceae cyanobacterium]